MSESSSVSAPEVERQQMSVDIVGVGFGPAMGGFLFTLSRALLNADGSPRLESPVSPGMPLQVVCYERADGWDSVFRERLPARAEFAPASQASI